MIAEAGLAEKKLEDVVETGGLTLAPNEKPTGLKPALGGVRSDAGFGAPKPPKRLAPLFGMTALPWPKSKPVLAGVLMAEELEGPKLNAEVVELGLLPKTDTGADVGSGLVVTEAGVGNPKDGAKAAELPPKRDAGAVGALVAGSGSGASCSVS